MSLSKLLTLSLVHLLSLFLLTACGGGGGSEPPPTPTTASITGAAQKGNFINEVATTVKAFKLNDKGIKSGEEASGTLDTQSRFSIPSLDWTGWTEIEVTGRYFNEATGVNSVDPITLSSYLNITSFGEFTTNVNLLTHLQAARTKKLLEQSGGDFTDVHETARSEIIAQVLGIIESGNDPKIIPSELTIDGTGPDNASLLLLSGGFLKVSSSNPQVNLTALTNDLSEDGDFDLTLFNDIKTETTQNGFLDTLAQNIGLTTVTNFPPVITSDSAINVDENKTQVTTITSSDPNTNTITYSLTGGADKDSFTIDANSGLLTFNSAPNFELGQTSFEVKVTATDDGTPSLSSDEQTLTITVNDAADVKPTLANSTGSIAENATAGTNVGSVTISNAGDTAITAITLAGTGASNFAVANDGSITVKSGASIDFESSSSYTLTAVASNASGNSTGVAVSIAVNDVNEAPSLNNISFDTYEKPTDQTALGQLQGTDPDGNSLTYRIISGDDNNIFEIGGSAPQQILARRGIDITPDTYALTVEVFDGFLTDTATITIKAHKILNILPLGDSITAGISSSQDKFSYRRLLKEAATADGFKFDYIGTQKDTLAEGVDFTDTEHEGWPGRTVDDIIHQPHPDVNNVDNKSIIDFTLTTNAPDVALIHLGTNDLIYTLPSDRDTQIARTIGTIDNIGVFPGLKEVIKKLRTKNPNMIILLAKVLPLDNGGTGTKTIQPTNIEPLNVAIAALATELSTSISPIVTVDQFTGIDAVNDLYDNVHPNLVGRTKMSAKWYTALKPFLEF